MARTLPLALAGCLAQALMGPSTGSATPASASSLFAATKQGALATPPQPRSPAARARPSAPRQSVDNPVEAAPGRADAHPPSEIERCVRGAVRPGLSRAAHDQTAFLLTGDAHVFSTRFSERQCLGFVAAGARNVQSLELSLRAQDGRLLSQSAKPTSLAYAKHCAGPGEMVYATVRVLDGQGEVVYASVPGESQLTAAVRRLEACTALGTPRPAPLDVGPEPEGESIDMQLEAARAELGELGYDAGHLLAYGALRPGQHAANGLVLSRDRCYALLALGSHEIVDLDLRVFGPTLPLSAAASDVSRSRAARVKLCAEAPARYVVDVSAFQGEGAYAVAALELSEPKPAPGVQGTARIAYAELSARMRSRGFDASVLTSGVLRRSEQLTVPLPLRAGACVAVGALEASAHAGGALQLGLKASNGQLLSLDTRADAPLLFHCAGNEPEALQVVVSASPGRRQARFVLLLGREAEEAAQ